MEVAMQRILLPASLAALTLVAGCVDEAELVTQPKPSAQNPPATVLLSSTDHLVRASMALRGVRPSVADLEAVAAAPEVLGELVDGYMTTAEFGKVVRDMHNEALLTRIDFAYFPAGFPAIGPVANYDGFHINTSLQEASLRLVEHVVMNDISYKEIVTAQYAVANDVVRSVWGMQPLENTGAEWELSGFSDGRPMAGVLSDPFVFIRHYSTLSNANRGRANAMSKALLCYDFLSRDIEIDSNIDLADPDVVNNAVVDNSACAACHQTLDPLASFFGDYLPAIVPSEIEQYPLAEFYFPGVFQYAGITLRDSAYFGQPGNDVGDLGRLVAEDPRFSLCAAQRFYSYLHQVAMEDVPLITIADLQGELLNTNMSAKALIKKIVMSDEFRASHNEDEELAEGLYGTRKVRPDQLASMFEDLTGFVWETYLDVPELELGRIELTTDSFLGFEVIGGGIDAAYVTRPSHTFNATSTLLLQTMAAEAAAFVVDRDFGEPALEDRKLLRFVSESEFVPETHLQQLVWLHKRLLGEIVSADSDEVTETNDLWWAAYEYSESTRRAWELTLSAMMQDIRIATY